MSWPILTVALGRETDVVLARQRARRIAELLGFDRQDQTRIATAVSEIARNALGYGGGGKVEFLVDDGALQQLTVVVSDHGPGIADLDAVLSGAYVSPTGMGVGILGARRLMDDFSIRSGPDGVTVRLSKALPAGRQRVTGRDLGRLAKEIRGDEAGDPVVELQAANQALLASLDEVKAREDELRARQDELLTLNKELEDTNRGVVALYGELDRTAERLREASETKSRFLSHISHEFRTPLNSIKALTGLLLDRVDGELSTEQEKQVGYIRKSAETLMELVNDLLDIAKVEAGKVEVRVAPFAVKELLAGLRGLLKPLQANAQAELVFEEPPDLPTVHTDEAKVAQILRNLVSNALKFTEKGEVRVSTGIEPDGRLAFRVSDTGIGLAPDDQQRIFQEFEQVRGPLQAKAKGTGLGLPLSRRLAELLGGELTVESQLGRGSTFTLRLPLDQHPAPTGMRRVLIADDEEAFRYALKQMVGAGHEVFEAEDGVAALAALAAHRPDVLFLDLNMPRMDGYAVLQRIADDPVFAELKVVVSTSAMLDDRDRARLERAEFVLSKDQISRETVGMLLGSFPP